MKFFLKKILPKSIINLYHFLKAYLAAFIYNFPSRKIAVIGITGTKGKSTTVYLLGKILREAGEKTGWSCSISFCDGQREIPNPFHMTMPDPFIIHKVLRQMVNNGAKFAVIEVTSEGIKQYRHLGIKFNGAVLTNLQPEHIEAHGGFENYKKAKLELFKKVSAFSNQSQISMKPAIIVVNGDDKNAADFLNFDNVQKWIFQAVKNKFPDHGNNYGGLTSIGYKIIEVNVKGSLFELWFDNKKIVIKLNLAGQFNIINAVAAGTCALALGIKLETIKKALEKVSALPGRMEFISVGQDFIVIVDLAHTPDSFSAIFEAVKSFQKPHSKIITLFGCAGGGRDKWKRSVMGRLAAQNSDYIILTNEDPYDDPPDLIIKDIQSGIFNTQFSASNLFVILDRQMAIKKAIALAQKDDIVLLLGKGTESSMVFEKGRKIPWNEREIAQKYLKEKIGTS